MALFTSVYSFNRVALVEDDQLYVSKNITQGLGKADRKRAETNEPYLSLTFTFLTAAVAKAYPGAVPPEWRNLFSRLFTPDVRFTSLYLNFSSHLYTQVKENAVQLSSVLESSRVFRCSD